MCGASEEAVTAALDLLASELAQAIDSPAVGYSHFLSLPLASHRPLVARLSDLRSSLLQSGGEEERAAVAGQERESGEEKSWEQQPGGQRGKGVKDKYGGVHPSIFINPATFHLTVQMLKLWSPLRVQAAADALQAAMPRVQEVLGDAPLVIRLLGLKCMRGHPSKAHVLYADMQEVDGGNRLRAVCEVLRAACREAGLVTPRDCHQPLKVGCGLPLDEHAGA
ncbi:unnamed protein product [Closterium sp. NIES-64]|nr:unnamed protein product [Closterium sp. NIES-64]